MRPQPAIECSIQRTLDLVGDRWTLLILSDCFLGARRFETFRERLGISRTILADRLAHLEECGVLRKVAYQDQPVRHEYRLTEKGIDLYPVLLSLVRWGDEWMADEHGPPVRYEHRGCGHTAMPTLHCPECGDAVGARDMRAKLAPVARNRQP